MDLTSAPSRVSLVYEGLSCLTLNTQFNVSLPHKLLILTLTTSEIKANEQRLQSK